MQSTQDKPFDLLKNKLFYVTFDIRTPRPHFLILPHEKNEINLDSGKMKLDEIQELMKAVRSVMSSYEIPSGILSFHRGSWFTKDPKRTFHAHICVDVKPYLEVFKEKKNEIAQSPLWKGSDVSEYPVNVSAYELNQKFEYYYTAKKNIDKLKLKDVEEAVLPTVSENGITRVLHPSHPKIGFVGKRNEIQPETALRVIEKFAEGLGLTNLENKGDDKGCHVCLYLGPVPTEEGWSKTAQDEEVLGYIVISGPLFYQFCPKEARQKWFSAFEKSKFACLT